jgi:hypothetical protein
MQEHTFTGRIASLVVFRVPEFGTRARFTIEDTGRYPVVCAVEGDVAREFIARFCAGDNITVRGIYDRQQLQPIHRGFPDIEYAPCKSRKTSVSRHTAAPDP